MERISTILAKRTDAGLWALGNARRNGLVFTSFLLAVLFAIANTPYFFAQSAPITLILLALFGWIEATPRPSLTLSQQIEPPPTAVALAFALSALVGLSSLWAPEPGATLEKSVLTALVISLTLLASRILERPHPIHRYWIASGVVLGVAIGLLIVAINVFTREAITRWVLWNVPIMQGRAFQPPKYEIDTNSIRLLSESFSNRAQTVAVVLLVPALALARFQAAAWARAALLAAAVLASGSILVYGFHESSKLALLVAGLAYLIGRLDIRALRATVIVGWCVSVLTMPLIVYGIGVADFDKSSWLPESARARIAIWRTTVERLRETPLLGIGAAGTEQLQRRNPDPEWQPGTPHLDTTARHAHNAYLQVWFELGAVGAALMLAFGLALISAIRRLRAPLQLFGLVQFSLSAAMIATSYGIWQIWFLATFAIATALLAALARCEERSESRSH